MNIRICNTSALEYQNNVGLQFTFNPTVDINISGNLSIDNLNPGNYGDSNEITIVSGTNSLGGYTLYATVGDNTHSNPSYNNTNLNHSNGTNTFTSISTNKANLASFDANSNTWGYSYCLATNDCTDSTYWVSDDYDSNNGNPSTGYNGLPLYTTSTGVKLVDTESNAGTSTIKFKIGARATNTQIAGTYSNVINFTAITKILTTNYTITYNDTSAEATGMPLSQSDTITAPTNVTLSSTEPTRDGYTFAGWCTVNNSSDPTTCSGTTYQAGDTYTINNTGGSVTVPLYAVWESNLNLIDFSISGTPYQTEENMTWIDWTASKYNTDGRYVLGCGREGCNSYYIVDTNQSVETDGLSSTGIVPHYIFGGGTVCAINLYPTNWSSVVANNNGTTYNVECQYWGGAE